MARQYFSIPRVFQSLWWCNHLVSICLLWIFSSWGGKINPPIQIDGTVIAVVHTEPTPYQGFTWTFASPHISNHPEFSPLSVSAVASAYIKDLPVISVSWSRTHSQNIKWLEPLSAPQSFINNLSFTRWHQGLLGFFSPKWDSYSFEKCAAV